MELMLSILVLGVLIPTCMLCKISSDIIYYYQKKVNSATCFFNENEGEFYLPITLDE